MTTLALKTEKGSYRIFIHIFGCLATSINLGILEASRMILWTYGLSKLYSDIYYFEFAVGYRGFLPGALGFSQNYKREKIHPILPIRLADISCDIPHFGANPYRCTGIDFSSTGSSTIIPGPSKIAFEALHKKLGRNCWVDLPCVDGWSTHRHLATPKRPSRL